MMYSITPERVSFQRSSLIRRNSLRRCLRRCMVLCGHTFLSPASQIPTKYALFSVFVAFVYSYLLYFFSSHVLLIRCVACISTDLCKKLRFLYHLLNVTSSRLGPWDTAVSARRSLTRGSSTLQHILAVFTALGEQFLLFSPVWLQLKASLKLFKIQYLLCLICLMRSHGAWMSMKHLSKAIAVCSAAPSRDLGYNCATGTFADSTLL